MQAERSFVFVFMVISDRLLSFMIKNINLFLFHVEFFLCFLCIINKSFNVYIIVFYGFACILNMRENFIGFFPRSLRFHYALEKSHVSSHISNNFIAANLLKSLNPPEKGMARIWRMKLQKLFSPSSHWILQSWRCKNFPPPLSRANIMKLI